MCHEHFESIGIIGDTLFTDFIPVFKDIFRICIYFSKIQNPYNLEKITHPDIALLERENTRLQDTITRLLDQQDSLIKQTENEQILRRESQEQVLKLTNQLSNLSERNVNLLEDNTKLDKSQTILKKAVVQLISYVAAKKKKAG